VSDRIFFKLTIDIPDLDDLDPGSTSSSLEYDAELVFESESVFFIKIFYEDSESLDRKVMSWDPKYSYSLLSKFIVKEVLSPQRLKHIDFGNYYHAGMNSGVFSQEFNKTFFTIKPKGIRLIYEAAEQSDSKIYLNHTAFKLIELNYGYRTNSPQSGKEFRFEALNNIKDFIDFNNIQFIPEHSFFVNNKSSDNLISIKKEPCIRIRHEGISESDVKEHVDILCGLYSFYTNKKIDWKYSKIYADGKLFVEIRDVEEEGNEFVHGLFIWDFSQNPLNLIKNVNANELIANKEFALTLIDRFNYALKANDEAKFMILFSLLEQLRNYYILDGKIETEKAGNPPKLNRVKEEYQFIHGKDKTREYIQSALKQIIEIVDESEKQLFLLEIPLKVSGIRTMSMVNQFDSYFKFAGVDPNSYDLDFQELKSLRDNIFHGKQIPDKDYLNKVNWHEHLPRLTGELLIKLFGINDLKSISQQKVWR
jgi:hypothetical protein